MSGLLCFVGVALFGCVFFVFGVCLSCLGGCLLFDFGGVGVFLLFGLVVLLIYFMFEWFCFVGLFGLGWDGVLVGGLGCGDWFLVVLLL